MDPLLAPLAALVPLLPGALPQDGAPAPARRPATFVTDVALCERVAERVASSFNVTLGKGLSTLDWERVARAFSDDCRGAFPRPGQGVPVPAAGLALEDYGAEGAPALAELDREGLVTALRAQTEGMALVEVLEWKLHELLLAEDQQSAFGAAQLALGGPLSDGGRAELHATLELELVAESLTRWTMRRVTFAGGHRASSSAAPFADVSDAVGFRLDLSAKERELLQDMVDERNLSTLGGISVVDWNGDGFPDLLASRRLQTTALFLNDGRGGFARGALPLEGPEQSGTCTLFLDLDGDGLEELVVGQVFGYAGTRARAGLWTRSGGHDGEDGRAAGRQWREVEGALALELPRGVREVSVQGVVPCDVNADGLLDLFFCVRSDSRSGGAGYNAFRALDGGENLLFVNQGGLGFREESDARGIAGRRYTYVAAFLDLDGDGDPDLLEGNDLGPSRVFANDGEGRFTALPDHPLSRGSSATMGLALADWDESGAWSLHLSGVRSQAGDRILPLAAALWDEVRREAPAIGRGDRLFTRDPRSGAWSERGRELGIAAAGWAWASLFLDVDGDGEQDLFVTNGNTSHRDERAPDWSTYHWRQVVADVQALEAGAPRRVLDPESAARFRGSFGGHERDHLFYNPGGPSRRLYDAAYVLGLDFADDGRSAVAVDADGDGDLDLALASLQGLRLVENRLPPKSFARVSLTATKSEPHALGAVVTLRAGGRARRRMVQATAGFQSQGPLELHFGLGAAERVEALRVDWPSGASQEWTDLPVRRRIALREGDEQAAVAAVPAWPGDTRPVPPPAASVAARARPLDDDDGGDAGEEQALAEPGAPAVVNFWAPWCAPCSEELPRLARLARELGAGARFAGVSVEREDLAAVRAAVAEHALGYPQFVADDALLEGFFGAGGAPAPPATFVFDAGGRLRRVFRRPLAQGELAALLRSLEGTLSIARDLVRQGQVLVQRGRPQEGLECFRAALEREPGLATVHDELGKLFASVENLEQAEASFARAVQLDPELAQAQLNLGAARMGLGRYEEALGPLHTAWGLFGDELGVLFALGNATALAGHLERALEVFTVAAEAHPQAPQVWERKARVLMDLGRWDEAQAHYERALVLEPRFAAARAGLEQLARRRGG